MKMKACTVLLATVVVFAVEVFGESGDGSADGNEEFTCTLKLQPESVFKTGECPVSTLPTKRVKYLLKSEKIRDKCDIDISEILKKLETNHNVLIVHLLCSIPLHLVFSNTQNARKKNTILYLQFQGQCIVSAEDISRWGSATDFRVLHMLGNTTWLEEMNDISYNGLKNINTLAFNKAKPLTFPKMFTKYVWPKMAEVSFSDLQLTSIPSELNAAMPLLQSLDVSHNKFTKPPNFPWSNSTLHLPRGLKRTLTGNHHYQYGSIVHPKIYRRCFNLSFNNIEDLSTYEFRGLLNKLTLEGNGLKGIGKHCFRGLREIHEIDLSKNKINNLPSELFWGLDDILHLKLGHNNLSVIPEKLFESQTKIKRIDLDHNKLSKIPKDLFSNLKSVEVLNLEHNQITKIDDEAFPTEPACSLQEIYLQNNKIKRIPKSLFQQQQTNYIDLSSNLLTFEDLVDTLEELEPKKSNSHERKKRSSYAQMQERQINFAHNNFTTINVNGFDKKKLALFEEFLSVYKIDMTGNPLLCDGKILDLVRWIRHWMQKDPCVQKDEKFSTWKCAAPVELKDKPILSVDDNQIKCLRNLTYCPKECLCSVRGCSSNGIVIVDCNGRNLSAMPHKVPRGQTELHFQNNTIQEIPPYPYLENVTALYLTHNQIERLNASTVERLQRMKIMFIDSNNLTALPKNMENLTFTTLALHHNFFKCDCTTKWMKNWLRKPKTNIKDIDNVLCNSENTQWRDRQIYTLPDEEFCNSSTSREIEVHLDRISTIIASILGGFLILTLVVFRYRDTIKVFVFTRFNWHPFDRRDDSDPSKIYDAFVSYSGNDYKWVMDTLRVRLENHDPPFKLCIDQRDFEIGAPILENILNSINQSKRVIVVLSRNFAKSNLCLLEFRAAHQKVLEDRMNYLIIILFDDVDMAELHDEIKLYMRTNTYLSVSNRWFWEKLVYTLPQNRERIPDHQSYCTNSGLGHSTEMVFRNEAFEATGTTGEPLSL